MECCHTEHAHQSGHTSGHGHAGGHGMDHGSAGSYLRRFGIVTVLLVPLLLTNTSIVNFVGAPELPYSHIIALMLTTIIFGFSLVFFVHAGHEIKARQYGMMTLVSIAVGAGYVFSLVSAFVPSLEMDFYIEISTLVWVLLFGHYLEARSSSAAGDTLKEVAKLLPKKAHVLEDGQQEHDVDVVELKKGDIVLVKPGEKVPADGTVEKGASNVNEALISGESKPVQKKVGDEVKAGSICLDGSLVIRLSEVGENSTVGQIQRLIRDAQKTKPRSQKIADRAAAVLTLVAISVALLTLLIWTSVLGASIAFSITLAITVLVIACPHALGLAIPTVTTITTSLAVKSGLFIKDLSKIEVIRAANYVVFDKTGTLTKGEFGVSRVTARSSLSENEILGIAASLEKHSSHVIGQSIVRYAKDLSLSLEQVDNFENVAGRGIQGTIGGETYFIGNSAFIAERGIPIGVQHENKSNTVVYLASETGVLAAIELSDEIKSESYAAVKDLHKMGIKVAMLTGDNEEVAREVAEALGIDAYFADVLPEDKYLHINKLQNQGGKVIMVGDGVNDAPALTQADVGIAVGAGTDVAVEAGDVVLLSSNPQDIVRLLKLSKKVYTKMIQNLVWALGYNIVAIPAAAGVFAAWGIFLRPEIGALAMSLSTVIVVANTLTLKTTRLSPAIT